jgi:hypothetical protein
MKFDIPPVARSQRSGFLDEAILTISKELFEIPLFGIGICGIVNILFLYLCYKKTAFISLCVFLLLYYLIIKIIQVKILHR